MANKKIFKRCAYKVEPVLHVHKYIVTISGYKKSVKGNWHTRYKYCINLKEVATAKALAKVGDVVEVYKAEHNYKQGWVRIS